MRLIPTDKCACNAQAYAHLFAGSLDLHAEMIEAAEALMSVACQPSDQLHPKQREAWQTLAIRCYAALHKADPDTITH